MTLAEKRQAHASGALAKHDYIAEMHRSHALLFEYPALMAGTDIGRIEISEGGVVMTFGQSGVRMLCDPHDQRIAPIETLNFGQYEHEEFQIVRRAVSPGSTVLDVGANYGWYALHIAKMVPGVKVLAFEPIPHTYSYLCQNIRLNDALNVEAHNFGISEQAGEVVFYFCDDSSGSASAANIGERADATKIVCPVDTLDHVAESRQLKVDFIKVDVEGAELLVFRGAQRLLAEQRPAILAEMLRKWSAKFNYHPNQIIALLASIGYRCYEIQGGRLRHLPQMREDTAATNFVFLDADKHQHLRRELAAGD